MKKTVENFLRINNLLSSNGIFIVGFSGGFDSMTLADILITLASEYNFTVVLAHLNHNWRGEKSKQEELNCQRYATDKNVQFYVETLDEDLPHTETFAREARYAFFERVAKKFNSHAIFTAHTKSDNIETVLQRIIKGTGVTGLKGISEVRGLKYAKVYRPLLSVTRGEVLAYCEQNNLKPNDDNSNSDDSYFRNKIRLSLLPELKQNYDENIENAIERLIQNAKDSDEIIEEYCNQKLSGMLSNDKILTKEFVKLMLPVQKYFVKQILEDNDLDYTQKKINEVFEFIEENSISKSGKTYSLSTAQWLFVNNKTIEVLSSNDYNSKYFQTELNLDGETIFDDICVKITRWNSEVPDTFPKETDNVVYADLTNIDLPLMLRTRLDGDRIIPFGKHTPIKLKKYLNNKGMSKHDKSKVLLISSPKEVLWVVNLGISNSIRVAGMPTHKLELYRRSSDG